MQPQESLDTNERIPEASTGAMPKFDASAPYNGMYASEADFQAAEVIYKIKPSVELNTVTFAEDNTAYPIATVEEVPTANETSFELAEVTEPTTETTPALTTEVAFDDTDVIDVEAKEVIVDPDSLDETDDIAELIANNEEITVGKEKLTLTTKLKNIASGVLSSLDHLLDTEPELPEEIDWRHYIMSEPDYDESYDYRLLQQLLNAQYRRKRAKLGYGKLMERMGVNPRVAATTEDSLAERAAAYPLDGSGQPPQPPETPTMTGPEGPNDGNNNPNNPEGEILKIEMDRPEGGVPQIGYEGAAPALTYEPAAEESPGQPGQKQITQQ